MTTAFLVLTKELVFLLWMKLDQQNVLSFWKIMKIKIYKICATVWPVLIDLLIIFQ